MIDGPISPDPKAMELIQWGFYALLAGCTVIATNVLISVKNSIIELNVNMAIVLERLTQGKHRMDKIEERIDDLEGK